MYMLLNLIALLFPFILCWFAGDGNGNGGGDGDSDSDDSDADSGEEGDSDESDEEDEGDEDADSLKKELSKARAALKKANAEAKERRLKLQEYEKAEAERKKSEMDEAERVKAELAEAEAERDTLRTERIELEIRHAVQLAAMEMGFNDPEDAYTLIDLAEVEVDEESYEVTGVDKALKALAKVKSYLLKAEEEDSHGTPPSGKKKGGSKGKLPEGPLVHL